MIKRNKSIVALLTITLGLSIIGVTSKTVYAGEYSSVPLHIEGQSVGQAKDSNGANWKYYKYDDGTICLKGTYDLKSVMEIPAELDGCAVTGIDSLLGYENTIMYKESIIGKPVNKVIIPSGIKVIGQGAFARCANLTEIQIPQSVKYIGACAFNDKWLEASRDSNGYVVVNGILVDGHKSSGDVTIPSNIVCIGDGAFGNYAFADRFPYYKNITSVTVPSSVKRIGKEAFLGCNLTKATIAEGVEEIDDNAFRKCINLTEAKIPQSVKALSIYAFAEDNALKSTTGDSSGLVISNGVLLSGKDISGDVIIPSTVTKIQDQAFLDNKNITSVKIPGSIKEIPRDAFGQCTNLTNVTIENGIESVGDNSFSGTSISKINLPDSVTNIGFHAFSNCEKLTEIKYKAGATIGVNAFKGTPWLDNLSKTGDLTILYGVVLKCDPNASGEIIIPNGVKEIAGSAFDMNMNITSIKIPEGVTRIGKFAFSECRNLTSVYVPASVTKIEYGAFTFCDKVTFTGPGAEFAKLAKASKKDETLGDNSNNQSTQANNGDSQNKIQPGWYYITGNWYYGESDGTKKTGWLYDGGNWYYFYGSGQMATGFIDLGSGYYYYLDESGTSSIGSMKTGWQKIYGNWFYFNRSSDSGVAGAQIRGWQYIDGNWYFFYYGDGIMARDAWIDGYYVNSSGAWSK